MPNPDKNHYQTEKTRLENSIAANQKNLKNLEDFKQSIMNELKRLENDIPKIEKLQEEQKTLEERKVFMKTTEKENQFSIENYFKDQEQSSSKVVAEGEKEVKNLNPDGLPILIKDEAIEDGFVWFYLKIYFFFTFRQKKKQLNISKK